MAPRISHDEETLYEPVFHDRSSSESSFISSSTDLLKEYKPWTANQRRTHKVHMILVFYFVPVLAVVSLIVHFTFPRCGSTCAGPKITSGLSHVTQSWEKPGDGLDTIRSMPQGELTGGITPIRCHSHNDYWRRVPLFDALAAGCTSVEADIWPADGLASPLVGHTRGSTTPDRTLQSLYIDPITAILEHRSQANGTGDARPPTVFDADDSTPASLVLLLDFKDRSPALWAAVQAQLQPLRDRGRLTRWDPERGARVTRAVTVVATGDAPFDAIVDAAHRDVFYDAPLDRLDAKYDVSNSHYASVSMGRAVGPVGWSLWPAQRAALGRQIKAAAERGLVSRYWGTASMPLVRRDSVWKGLLDLGVGVLNGDDVNCMAEMLSNRLA